MSQPTSAQTYVVALETDNPLLAEELAATLLKSGTDAFVRGRNGASTDALGAIVGSTWQVLVTSDSLEAAQKVAADLEEAVERDSEANAQAAEEEAMSGETKIPDDV